MKQRQTRAEVPTEQTWNLDDLFTSDADWSTEYAAIDAALPGIAQNPSSAITILANKLPAASTFFLTYFVCLTCLEGLFADCGHFRSRLRSAARVGPCFKS